RLRHNLLPQLKRQPRNGSRWSADLQAATVFRPPSIGRPILRVKECSACCPFRNARRAGLRPYSHSEQLPHSGLISLSSGPSKTFQQPLAVLLRTRRSAGTRPDLRPITALPDQDGQPARPLRCDCRHRLARIAATWNLAVWREIPSRRAITLLEAPSAMAASTSCSRGVSETRLAP